MMRILCCRLLIQSINCLNYLWLNIKSFCYKTIKFFPTDHYICGYCSKSNLYVSQVERRERDHKRRLSILLIRFYLQNGNSRLNQARRNLLERSKWHASRIMSLTSQLREFQALSSIKDIPLLPIILNPVNGSCNHNVYKEVDLSKLAQPLQRILKSSFNDSQLQAISAAIGLPNSNKQFDLSLIQGPPGL